MTIEESLYSTTVHLLFTKNTFNQVPLQGTGDLGPVIIGPPVGNSHLNIF